MLTYTFRDDTNKIKNIVKIKWVKLQCINTNCPLATMADDGGQKPNLRRDVVLAESEHSPVGVVVVVAFGEMVVVAVEHYSFVPVAALNSLRI